MKYYIMEVEGEGCYCLCYDDVDGNRVVIDWDLEIREDWIFWNQLIIMLRLLVFEVIIKKQSDNHTQTNEHIW